QSQGALAGGAPAGHGPTLLDAALAAGRSGCAPCPPRRSPSMKKKRTPEEWLEWLNEFSRGANREAWRGIMCLLRWVEIREENGHPVPPYMRAIEGDLFHSPLLRRLLDGKEPLPCPPPERKGQPWYELLETGRGVAKVVAPWQWAP